jgi:predicted XRE-type DNA-binding protein
LTPATTRVKTAIAKSIAKEIEARQLTQTEASYQIKEAPSQISLVVGNRLRGFSLERLMRMALPLGHDIEVVITKSRGSRGTISCREA